MPRIMEKPPVKPLLDQCIEAVAADDTIEHDFASIAALQHGQISFEILKKKLLPHNNLKRHQIDGLVSKQLCVIKEFYTYKPGRLYSDYDGLNRHCISGDEIDYGNDELVQEILETIAAKKCPLKIFHILTKLCIDIKMLLPAFTKVQEVDLFDTPFDEDSLKTLKDCSNLRSLRATAITLREDVHDFIIKEFKNLKSAPSDNLYNVISRLRKSDPNFSTSINSISFFMGSDVQLDEVISAMKEIETIYIHTDHEEDRRNLSCLNAIRTGLKTFIIQGRLDYGVNYIFKVIEYHGKTLTQIDFTEVAIKISHVIYHCPHIKELLLEDCTVLDSNTQMKLVALKNLTKIRFYSHFSLMDMNETCWRALLADANNLEALMMLGIDGTSLQKALKTVYTRHNFPSLKRLYLVKVNCITFKDIQPMIEYSENPLRYVFIDSCPDVDKDGFASYKQRIEERGYLDISICQKVSQ